jgi:predicted HAD superfamily Cof-like phosphohydrolase
MMKETALQIASRMPLPAYAQDALRYSRHPQDRTLAFHTFYGSPIRSQRPDRQFSHMDDQRVAFRAAFILSEVAEMFKKGLGVDLIVGFRVQDERGNTFTTDTYDGTDDMICVEINECLKDGGRRDLVEVVDALGDLNVVVNGFAIELGVDMRAVDGEICASNFTKADENGQPIIGDGTNGPVGKVLKGPNFVEPQLARTLGLGDE